MRLSDFSVQKLKKRFRSEENHQVKERLHILLLLRENQTQREVSRLLHISVGKVPFWKARFEKEGYNGLLDKEGRGRKSLLIGEQFSALRSALDKPIRMENGYTRGWQTKDVRLFIRKEFGIPYKPRNVRRIVRNIGIVRLVPRPRNMSRNQESVEEFKKKVYP